MDAVKLPKESPSETHEVVVVLDNVHLPIDDIDTDPRSHELIVYHRVSNADEVRDRIQCASIVVATQTHINAESLGDAPYLKCVVTPTAGTNHIDLDECRRRGIKVAKCPGSTSLAVPQHALSLYFAARRKTVIMHNTVRSVDSNGDNAWKREHSVAHKMQSANGQPPLSLEQEVVGIIGYGLIGQGIEKLCKALGMEVLVLGRKGAAAAGDSESDKPEESYPARVPFEEAIRKCTVLFLSCIFNESTRHMIDVPELAVMRPEMILINVSRGGVMHTGAVVQALREKRISGAAVDVFDREPASNADDSAFLAGDTADLNLTFSPHVGWFSTKTVSTMKAMVKQRIRNYVAGDWADFEV